MNVISGADFGQSTLTVCLIPKCLIFRIIKLFINGRALYKILGGVFIVYP